MSTSLRTVHLDLPASREQLAALEIGTVVYLTGRVFTAREGVYRRAVEEAGGLPAPPAYQICLIPASYPLFSLMFGIWFGEFRLDSNAKCFEKVLEPLVSRNGRNLVSWAIA